MPSGGHNWKGGGTVEATRSLDIMALCRAGYLSNGCGAGQWTWTYGDGTKAWIQIRGGRDQITLEYRYRSLGEKWQQTHQSVPIRWTPCRFGGARPWFICDAHSNDVYCGRQVTKLYGAGRLFACRQCYRLGISQRADAIGRASLRLGRLHRKLQSRYEGRNSPPPTKPRWMRRRTYRRITGQIRAGEADWDNAFVIGAQRILARKDGSSHRKRSRKSLG
jgi:hypothetical protein